MDNDKSGIRDREPRPHSSFYTEIITEAKLCTRTH